ncbi:MAG: hypothetical protein NC121_03830 [Blautia sp.]|nr:hypothetical protein [Blautia sp.]
MSKDIDLTRESESRYQTYFSCKIHAMGKAKEIKCNFDTGAEVTIIGLIAIADDEREYEYLREKIKKNGKQIDDINSYSGRIKDVYELPVTSLQVAEHIFNNISVCISLNSEKSVIGMDIIGLYDFTYDPVRHFITYNSVRKWKRNPNVKYTIARKIEDIAVI